MNITAKSRYALKIMMDLVVSSEEGHQQRHKIAQRQGIPLDFMDHILARLRSAHLIESIRGRTGGFQLKKIPDEISLWDIFSAVEDAVYPVRCIDQITSCSMEEFCISHDVWAEVYKDFIHILKSKSLNRMAQEWSKKTADLCFDDKAVFSAECKGPVRARIE